MPEIQDSRESLYRILWEAVGVLARVQASSELLQSLCTLLTRVPGFDRVRVTQYHSVILVTAAEAGAGEAPPLFWEKHVLETGRPVLTNDLALGDARFGPWTAAAVYPLRVEGDVWGCLGIYAAQRPFTSEDDAVLRDLAAHTEAGLQARLAEQSRSDNEQFLNDMANLVPGLFYKLRWQRGRLSFLYASPGIDLLLPLTPDQLVNDARSVFGALHPSDRRRFYRAGRRSLDQLTVFNLEFRIVRPNGAPVWVLATAFPQKVDDAVVWTGLAIDVTPQNKLQEALQREQELLSVVLNNIGDGVVAVDGAGAPTLVNRTALRLLDWETAGADRRRADLAALPWNASDRFHPWQRRRDDGSLLHWEVHVSDLPDGGRGPQGRVLLLRDVTDRDRIEDRLRQSEKLESIGLLAGGIAHDFNNLLTGVFGFIQLARMNADQPERVVSYLDHALGPFQRARTLTQQLLTFAKGGEISRAPLRIADLVPAILQFVLQGSPVDWEWTTDEPPWAVLANEAQMHQLFENLIVNAKQVLTEGGRLRVGLKHHAAPGPEGRDLAPGAYLEATVEDSGPGVEAEIASKIFDPFFTTKTGGTGLGLSICFSIVRKHGGSIEVDRSPLGGALFRLWLPAVSRAAGEA